MQLPIGSEDAFAGVIDLVEMKAIVWSGEELGANFDVVDIPEEYKEQAATYREKLMETVVEVDDDAMMSFLEGIGMCWALGAAHQCFIY